MLLCVLGLTEAQGNPERQIRVELELGDSYAVALGDESSAMAKQLAETALIEALAEKVATQIKHHAMVHARDEHQIAEDKTALEDRPRNQR